MDQAKSIPSDDLSGQTFGDFQIIRKLGQGGMGQVYLAEQRSLKRKVALKFLRTELAANEIALTRFRAEAEAVASINHANIVQVYTVGTHAGLHYMVLEYVEGLNLRAYLEKKGAPDLPRALLILRQVAAALQRASETGIVHRDIKPENILLTRKGEVKVTDFGLSRMFGINQDISLTASGITMGTPLYMSPEQVQGKPVDPRSDIYSFGVTAFHILAGRPPFSGATPFEVALKHVNEQPPALAELRPDLPRDVVQLVERMMLKDPALRPQTGREVLRVLNATRGQTGENPFGDLQATVAVRPLSSSDATISMPSATIRAMPSIPWKLIAAGVLAVAFGAAIGLGTPARRSINDRPKFAAAESSDEEFLVTTSRRFATANLSEPAKLQSALKVNVELGVLYLDERRYSDAKAFNSRLTATDSPPPFQFQGQLFEGMLYAFVDEPEKAVAALQLAMSDKSANKYLAQLNMPPSHESIDLRFKLVEALARIEKSKGLPPDLVRLKNESMAILSGRGPGPGKKGI